MFSNKTKFIILKKKEEEFKIPTTKMKNSFMLVLLLINCFILIKMNVNASFTYEKTVGDDDSMIRPSTNSHYNDLRIFENRNNLISYFTLVCPSNKLDERMLHKFRTFRNQCRMINKTSSILVNYSLKFTSVIKSTPPMSLINQKSIEF